MSTEQKTAAHTPGPWVAGRSDMATIVDGYDSKWIYGGPDQDQYVAVASGGIDGEWDEVMANAYLIAAAPEMLEALEAARVWVILATARIDAAPEAIQNARDDLAKLDAAIAKARGS